MLSLVAFVTSLKPIRQYICYINKSQLKVFLMQLGRNGIANLVNCNSQFLHNPKLFSKNYRQYKRSRSRANHFDNCSTIKKTNTALVSINETKWPIIYLFKYLKGYRRHLDSGKNYEGSFASYELGGERQQQERKSSRCAPVWT